ncbi:MAG: hypothetical protein R3C05_12480 [Pirellulaceae bacterium]
MPNHRNSISNLESLIEAQRLSMHIILLFLAVCGAPIVHVSGAAKDARGVGGNQMLGTTSSKRVTSDHARDRDRCYAAVADGWRRTSQGWENAMLWNPDVTYAAGSEKSLLKPMVGAQSYVNYIGQLHPALIAMVQLLSAAYLMKVTHPSRSQIALQMQRDQNG